MVTDKIIYYDEEFIRNFEKLRELIEGEKEEDKPLIHRFLIDHFGMIFRTAQYYWFHYDDLYAEVLKDADEETKREMMRPLTHRQYRMVERSFSQWLDEEWQVIWSIWDFLHDSGKIYDKKIMSAAEVSCASIVLEEVYVCLARKHGLERNEKR